MSGRGRHFLAMSIEIACTDFDMFYVIEYWFASLMLVHVLEKDLLDKMKLVTKSIILPLILFSPYCSFQWSYASLILCSNTFILLSTEQFLELPGEFGYSELTMYRPRHTHSVKSFAWMTGNQRIKSLLTGCLWYIHWINMYGVY